MWPWEGGGGEGARGGGGGRGEVNLIFVFIFYLVRLWLGCIPKISFIACLEVPYKFVWVGGGWLRANLVIALAEL
jgi:hypothetical protein